MSDETFVCEFRKNSGEVVRATLGSYKGHELADLRVFYEVGGKWQRTRRGLTLSVSCLDELAAAVEKLRSAVAVRGGATSRSKDEQEPNGGEK